MSKQYNIEMSGFQPVFDSYIDEIRAHGYYFKHKATGAELFFIDADDDNKVFSVGFSTVPTDDTGVAHIVEHCVLCGSEKYPLKELFMTLHKSSMNTFLNAMTFPDKTIYPVASQNDQDFMNLIDVYMDSVFHPTMYRDELFFRQEGHGFDFETGEEGIPSGVVYNEMKGAMASPDEMLSQKAATALFTNTYQYNSGGDPEAVLDLKYEDFLAFHKKHYHPSNARFFLYGNAQVERILAYLDQCIAPFGKANAVAEPTHEAYHGEPKYVAGTYSSEDKTAVATMQFVLGDSYDVETGMAAEILTSYLFTQDTSPFRKALIESGFCTDLYGSANTYTASSSASLTLFGLKEFDPKKVEARVFEELRKVDGAQLTKSLRATLNIVAFKLREADSGNGPRGMMPMFNLLLHVKEMKDPFDRLRFEKYIAAMEQMIAFGEHLKLIDRFFLNNNHRATVVLTPESEAERREKEANAPDKSKNPRWDVLSAEERKREREWYERLRAQQEAPDPEEALAALPKIRLSDIAKMKDYKDIEVKEFEVGGKPCKYLFQKLDTGIMYLVLHFPVSFDSSEELALFATAVAMLGKTDTERFSAAELGDEIMLHSGGIKFGMKFQNKKSYLTVGMKTLPEKLGKNLELVEEVLLRTKIADAKRLAEVLSEGYTRMQQDLIGSGNEFAAEAILAGSDIDARNTYYSTGIGYFQWMKSAMKEVEEKGGDALAEKASKLLKKFVYQHHLTAALGGDEKAETVLKETLPAWMETLPKSEAKSCPYSGGAARWSASDADMLCDKSSAFVIPADIQFVALGGSTHPLGGTFYVLSALLRTEYLWPEVRMKGGAYGANITFDRKGHFVFHSYRDPNLVRTIDAFKAAPAFVKNNLQTLETSILSAIRGFDKPMSPSKQFKDALERYLSGISAADLQRERTEILETNEETIGKAADTVAQILENGRCYVVGSEKEIMAVKERFERIEKM